MSDLIDKAVLMEKMHKYGFTAPDMTVHEFIEDELPTIPAPRWVRCEDELPDEVGSYLVYAPTYIGGSSSAKECKAGVMFARWLKGGHWSIEVGYYKRPGCVTHWMPLPEPPKEDA